MIAFCFGEWLCIQVAKKGSGMVKNEAGLWVKAKGGASRDDEDMDDMPPPMERGRGRGQGLLLLLSFPRTLQHILYVSRDAILRFIVLECAHPHSSASIFYALGVPDRPGHTCRTI